MSALVLFAEGLAQEGEQRRVERVGPVEVGGVARAVQQQRARLREGPGEKRRLRRREDLVPAAPHHQRGDGARRETLRPGRSSRRRDRNEAGHEPRVGGEQREGEAAAHRGRDDDGPAEVQQGQQLREKAVGPRGDRLRLRVSGQIDGQRAEARLAECRERSQLLPGSRVERGAVQEQHPGRPGRPRTSRMDASPRSLDLHPLSAGRPAGRGEARLRDQRLDDEQRSERQPAGVARDHVAGPCARH